MVTKKGLFYALFSAAKKHYPIYIFLKNIGARKDPNDHLKPSSQFIDLETEAQRVKIVIARSNPHPTPIRFLGW